MTTEERFQKLEEMQKKNQIMTADILESIMRLERIVLSHSFDLTDLNARLDELENRKKKVQ